MDLEQALLEAIRNGDLHAAKVYGDYLESQGRNRPRYVIHINDHAVWNELSDENVARWHMRIQEWLENKVPALYLPPFCSLFIVTDKFSFQISGQRSSDRDTLLDMLRRAGVQYDTEEDGTVTVLDILSELVFVFNTEGTLLNVRN